MNSDDLLLLEAAKAPVVNYHNIEFFLVHHDMFREKRSFHRKETRGRIIRRAEVRYLQLRESFIYLRK
ncbi:hypothetical protein KPH14_002969 [Odynerus spinipes]|uniref:Uncharacterized protein n=1 Tax=Odynerus spinipes TaxID=1348599 RepID=A0AAD9RX23_9HYME|nr:hypothetical protein KPH14_002969 [Odynerus spinipes]